MAKSKYELKYWQALERLIEKKALVVDCEHPRFKISNISVAKEAGKQNPKGYIRPERYPALCEAIVIAEQRRAPSKAALIIKDKAQEVDSYQEIKSDYDRLLAKYLNVIVENYELKLLLEEKKVSD